MTLKGQEDQRNPQRTEDIILEYLLRERELPICDGFTNGAQWPHSPAIQNLNISRNVYSIVCPICGYGEAGTLSENIIDRLQEVKNNNKS